MKEIEFIWEHFKLNAEQRLKGFNLFVVLSIFADGGVFTAIERGSILTFYVFLVYSLLF